MDGYSKDIVKEDIEKLRSIFPQCVVEGKVKIDQLLNLFGEYDEKDFEKYEFTWKGKNECYKVARERTRATLLPCESESINFNDTENVYIEGDNLEVLKILQQGYYNKIKMIYIDPPYNTGNDFVYKDNYRDSLENYKNIVSSTGKSNPETSGRFHTDWLNMMFPRLMLAHTLLKDDGVIFISIDDNEVDNLKKMCNEIFGESNFISNVIWEKKYSPANDSKVISATHDHILVYAKNLEFWEMGLLERTKEMNNRYKNLDNDPRGAWKPGGLSAKTYNAKYDYPVLTPSGKIVNPPTGSCWQVSQERLEELIKDNRIYFGKEGNSKPQIKQFLTEVNQGVVPKSIWKLEEVGHGQISRKEVTDLFGHFIFDNPKPIKLLNRIIKIANTKENDIILDFFSGSATTAHAVMQLNAEDGGNRKYIMVQLPQLCDEKTEAYKNGYKNICEIGKERIRRAGAKIKEEMENTENLDTGFRVFKLDSTNFNRWNVPLFEDTSAMVTAKHIINKDYSIQFEILGENEVN